MDGSSRITPRLQHAICPSLKLVYVITNFTADYGVRSDQYAIQARRIYLIWDIRYFVVRHSEVTAKVAWEGDGE
jgi:hypothetical protein